MTEAPTWIRRGRRVIRMVTEVHRMGYQLLRIAPYEYPLAWRCTVAPKIACARLNGAFVLHDHGDWPTYSSASENEYFNWQDAKSDDARAMAAKFVARFPLAAEEGYGSDWSYAGWLVELLGVLERHPGMMPITIAPDIDVAPLRHGNLTLRHYPMGAREPGTPEAFPLPPPGLAEERFRSADKKAVA
jgi:hypothetical protein